MKVKEIMKAVSGNVEFELNKKQLKAIANGGISIQLTEDQVRGVVDGYVDVVKENLPVDEKIPFPGLGHFEMAERAARAARKGISPATKEECDIPAVPARKVPKFTMSKPVAKELTKVL